MKSEDESAGRRMNIFSVCIGDQVIVYADAGFVFFGRASGISWGSLVLSNCREISMDREQIGHLEIDSQKIVAIGREGIGDAFKKKNRPAKYFTEGGFIFSGKLAEDDLGKNLFLLEFSELGRHHTFRNHTLELCRRCVVAQFRS